MTAYTWSALYAQATEAFGMPPRPEDEAAITAAFEANPGPVAAQLPKLAAAVATGKINYGWAVWAKQCAQGPAREITAAGEGDLDRNLRLAETWVRNAGLHYDSEAEVIDEAFGARGRLEPWAADDLLRHRIATLWREQRPRGQTVEAETLARAAKWKTDTGGF